MTTIPTTPAIAKIINKKHHQVVQFPDNFRLNAKEVKIEKIGDTVIIRPKIQSSDVGIISKKKF